MKQKSPHILSVVSPETKCDDYFQSDEMTPSYAAPFPPSIQPLTFPAFTLPTSPTMTLFSYKIPQRGMAHKALLWLGCGFALSGLWTSEKQCGKPLESCCPLCRYLTLHGVGKRCHSHNRAPQVAQGNQQRPNTVWQLLKHERGIEDNFFSGAVAGIVCVSVCTQAHYQLAKNGRTHMFFVCPVNIPSTERRMETDTLRCSSAFFLFEHPLTSTHG